MYGLRDACPRNVLAYLSERDRRAGNATALDVGLTQTLPETSPESSVPYQLGGVGAGRVGACGCAVWLCARVLTQ